MTTTPVSVIVLTLNEEVNLPRCLESLRWCNDVVVLDSFSTDATTEIAKICGARLFQRKFDDYAKQRNHALKEIEYKNPWVLMVDADEVVPEEMVQEIGEVLASCKEEVTLFRMRRKDFFLGQWIKHSSSYKELWFGRLMRVGRVWVERAINEEFHTDGQVALLQSSVLHYPFNKGFHSWLEKHNKYSSMEADLKFHQGVYKWKWSDFRHVDPATKRKALKALAYSLPGRPLIMFIGRYLVKGGIMDGRAGFTYCILKTIYEYMIDFKVRELSLRKQGLPI